MTSGPLAGIRVLEFTQIIAGPLGCQLLADLGADVIKVEPPQGEPWRLQGEFLPQESKVFQSLNRGKRSLAVDLSDQRVTDALHSLITDIDVVVINYRPDVAERLHIDYETLSAINPKLIYVDNTAFGRNGPWADRPGYDIVVQAASGLMAAVAKVDEKGTPLVGPAVADFTTGYSLALGTCAALFYRSVSGKGQKVETSLLANALTLQSSSFMSLPADDAETRANFIQSLEQARADGLPYSDFLENSQAMLRSTLAGNIYYRSFVTADGAIAIGALSTALRDKVRAALGVEHNRDEPDYDPLDPDQMIADDALVDEVEIQVRSESTAHWVEHFTNAGVPVSTVHFVQELLDHPQVAANGYAVELDHEISGPQTMVAPPWTMSESPPTPQGAAPPLGRDTEAVLMEAGLSADQVATLRADGVAK